MRICKNCNKELTKAHQKVFCSNKCKLNSDFYKNRKQSKSINELGKIAVCNLDGWKTKDYNNNSGILVKHLNKIGITDPNYQSYFTIKSCDIPKTIECPACDFISKDVNNKSGTFTKHILNKHKTTVQSFIEKYPKLESLFYHQGNLANYYKDLEQPEKQVVCQICLQAMMKITETHTSVHGITVAQYKREYPNAPIISKDLAADISKRTTAKNKSTPFKKRSKAEIDLQKNIRRGRIRGYY